MLAIFYLAAMIYFGDRISRYFYRFHSTQQRFATAFLIGLLLSSGITYLGALSFSRAARPLLFGNLVFLVIFLFVALKMPARKPSNYLDGETGRPPGKAHWDWLCLSLCFLFGCWLMWATLSFPDGDFQFGFKSWSDFGANLSVAQSFLLGHNFPSEHPFFPGETLRYHFLFWFQGANFAFLGLPLVTSVNLLSILSLLSLLVLIITFTEIIFESRAVGRIAAALFVLAASSLSYIPYLWAQPSLNAALQAVLQTTQFLNSGYPYRGEDWGALTVDIFANQRHLISAVGLLFVVVIFLADFYLHTQKNRPEPVSDIPNEAIPQPDISENKEAENIPQLEIEKIAVLENEDEAVLETKDEAILENVVSQADETIQPETVSESKLSTPKVNWGVWNTIVFSGVVIGLLPYWNSAVLVAAFILLGSLWLFFPRRQYMTVLLVVAFLVSFPQLIMLRSGTFTQAGQSLFNWGYIIAEPTPLKIFQYLGWTFGFKWLLLVVALWFLSGAQRRFFLAVSSLVAVVFLFQLSTDAFNNHKLLNIWNIFAGIFAAYGLWRVGRGSVLRHVLAVCLALAMTLGAIIDIFPVYNDTKITIAYKNDRLTQWLLANTKPSDVFLTHTFLTHPILFTGRKTFLGYTLFAWTAGYNVGEREAIYKQIFQERNPEQLIRLLRKYKIAYVGIDNDLRNNHLVKGFFNETVFQQNFPKVFEDTELRYATLTIYKVPVE